MTRPFLPGGVTCAACGYRMDAASGIDGAVVPTDGAVSICARCGELACFEQTPFGMRLRPVTDAERAEMMADETVATVVAVARSRRLR